jgi:hypothetical protein
VVVLVKRPCFLHTYADTTDSEKAPSEHFGWITAGRGPGYGSTGPKLALFPISLSDTTWGTPPAEDRILCEIEFAGTVDACPNQEHHPRYRSW